MIDRYTTSRDDAYNITVSQIHNTTISYGHPQVAGESKLTMKQNIECVASSTATTPLASAHSSMALTEAQTLLRIT